MLVALARVEPRSVAICTDMWRITSYVLCALHPQGPLLSKGRSLRHMSYAGMMQDPNMHSNRLLTETEQIMISGRASTGQAVWEGLTCVGSRLGSTQVGEEWSGGGDAACARWRMRRLGVRSSTCRIVPEAVSIP